MSDHIHAFIQNHKGIRIMLRHDLLEHAHFIFGNQYVKHAGLVVGVRAVAVPSGDAAVQTLENLHLQLVAVLFGDNFDLHIDVLRMGPIDGK